MHYVPCTNIVAGRQCGRATPYTHEHCDICRAKARQRVTDQRSPGQWLTCQPKQKEARS